MGAKSGRGRAKSGEGSTKVGEGVKNPSIILYIKCMLILKTKSKMCKKWGREFDHLVSRRLTLLLSENIPHLFLISFHSNPHTLTLTLQTWFPCPLTLQACFPCPVGKSMHVQAWVAKNRSALWLGDIAGYKTGVERIGHQYADREPRRSKRQQQHVDFG